MALPTYKRRGIMYGDLPRVETASLKEGAQMFSGINRRLDQLSSFIEREGTAYAKEQAIQYAAQNPVTEEQIQEAITSKGEQKSWLSALTGGNVYDETLQAAQGTMLANQLSIEATKKFRQLQVLAENNQLGFDEAQVEINDIIDGYAATISAFSPEASMKARASMASKGNDVLRDVAEKQSKIFAAAQKAKMEDDIFELKRSAEDSFKIGDSWNPTSQTYIRAEDRVSAIMQPLLEQAVASGQEGKVPAIYKAFREARINGVTAGLLDERFAASHSEAMQRINNGDLGEYESSWAVMSDDERAKVKQKFYAEVANRKKLEIDSSKETDKALRMEAYQLMDEAISADPNRRRELMTRAWEINAEAGKKLITDTQLEKLRTGDFDSDEGTDRLMADLEYGVDQGSVTRERILQEADAGNISFNQVRKLQNRMAMMERRDIKDQVTRINTAIDANVSPFETRSQVTAQKAKVKSQFLEEVDTTDEKPEEVANRLIQEQQTAKRAQALDTAVQRIAAAMRKTDQYKDTPEEILDGMIKAMLEDPTEISRWVESESIRRVIEKSIKSLKATEQ